MTQSSSDSSSQLSNATHSEDSTPLDAFDPELEYLQMHLSDIGTIEETTRRYYNMLNYYASVLHYPDVVTSENVHDFLGFLLFARSRRLPMSSPRASFGTLNVFEEAFPTEDYQQVGSQV